MTFGHGCDKGWEQINGWEIFFQPAWEFAMVSTAAHSANTLYALTVGKNNLLWSVAFATDA